MDWRESFIDQVLSEVPDGDYRERMEAELRDHMEMQYRALRSAGRSSDEAQTEALRLMGEPERLQKEYKSAWRRTPGELGDILGFMASGCVVMGTLYIFTFILLSTVGFTYDAIYPERVCFPLLSGNKIYVTVYSTVLFLIPFTFGALFLRFCFRRECRPVRPVTAGLLAAWAGERMTIILLSAMIYDMPLSLDLLTRIYHGGDTTAPWFSPVNYVLTFLGCILLGQLFGRLPAHKNRRRTA